MMKLRMKLNSIINLYNNKYYEENFPFFQKEISRNKIKMFSHNDHPSSF